MKSLTSCLVLSWLFLTAIASAQQPIPGSGAAATFPVRARQRVGPATPSHAAGCGEAKGALVIGFTISPTLGDAGSCLADAVWTDTWTFSALAGQQYRVSFTSPSKLKATIQDAASGGALATSDSASCPGYVTSCSFTYVVPSSSPYALAMSSTATGSYTLTVEGVGAPPPSGLPDLTPYRVVGTEPCTPVDLCSTPWSDSLVVSKVAGNHADDTSFSTSDTLYVDWAVVNVGSGSTAATFDVELYVDGVLRRWWFKNPPFDRDRFLAVQDFVLGSLGPGIHTIGIRIDPANSVPEEIETNNDHSKTITVTGSATCAAAFDALCLNASRFRVTASWINPAGAGAGAAVPLTADTGYFWFFTDTNAELIAKVVDGRALNGHFWFFAGGLTNVDTTLVVTDTLTGATRTYRNPANTPFQPIQDTSAF